MKKVIAFVFLICAYLPAYAQNVGFGLDFLNIGPSSTALSTSEARTGTLTGASSIYFNPALLALEKNNSLDLSYTSWIGGQENIFGGLNSINKNRAFAIAVYSARIGGIEERERPGPANGTFNASYLSVAGAFAYNFRLFSLGVTGQFLNESLFLGQATGYAFNFGIARKFGNDRVVIGASVLNLGSQDELIEESTELPANFRAGTSINIGSFSAPGRNDFFIELTLHADYVYMFDEINQLSEGTITTDQGFANLAATFEIGNVIQVQSGYRTGDTDRPLSFGTGIILENLEFNYALVPFTSGFGTAHSVGIRYLF